MSSLPTSSGELVVRRSRVDQVSPIVLLAFNACLGLISSQDRGTALHTAERVLLMLSLVYAALRTVDVVRSGPRSAPLLRIGPAGLTVPGAELVRWSDIDSVRITHARWGGRIQAVAFLPRPGRTVPAVRPFGLRRTPGGGNPGRAVARYGSALVVLPRQMTVTASQAIQASQVFGHLDTPWTATARQNELAD